jgi:hypothetical protein
MLFIIVNILEMYLVITVIVALFSVPSSQIASNSPDAEHAAFICTAICLGLKCPLFTDVLSVC